MSIEIFSNPLYRFPCGIASAFPMGRGRVRLIVGSVVGFICSVTPDSSKASVGETIRSSDNLGRLVQALTENQDGHSRRIEDLAEQILSVCRGTPRVHVTQEVACEWPQLVRRIAPLAAVQFIEPYEGRDRSRSRHASRTSRQRWSEYATAIPFIETFTWAVVLASHTPEWRRFEIARSLSGQTRGPLLALQWGALASVQARLRAPDLATRIWLVERFVRNMEVSGYPGAHQVTAWLTETRRSWMAPLRQSPLAGEIRRRWQEGSPTLGHPVGRYVEALRLLGGVGDPGTISLMPSSDRYSAGSSDLWSWTLEMYRIASTHEFHRGADNSHQPRDLDWKPARRCGFMGTPQQTLEIGDHRGLYELLTGDCTSLIRSN